LVGSGAFEEQDLERVAAELSQLAHDFELCDAQAEGYMQAVEDTEKRNDSAISAFNPLPSKSGRRYSLGIRVPYAVFA
jgi:hypothetical protein